MKIRIAAALGLLALLGLAGWSLSQDPVAQTTAQATRDAPTVTIAERASEAPPDRGLGLVASTNARPQTQRPAAALSSVELEQLRRAILDSVTNAKLPARSAAAPADDAEREADGTSGDIKDRIGGRQALMDALNHDFLPLTDECIQAAHERDPALAGMLAIGLVVAGDAELGSIVEAVQFGERNQLTDAALLECVENTALSTLLPAPPEGVEREQFEITLPIEAVAD